MNRATSYLSSVKDVLGLTPTLSQRDIVAEAVDLSGGKAEAACGVAFFVAIISALQGKPSQTGTVILGDLTIQGNLKGLASITEPLQVCLQNGALRVLVPISNKSQFAALPEEVVEKVDVIWYGDVDRALIKALELS